METVICPYCNEKAELKDSSIIYHGKSYGMVYICPNFPKCDSYVGVYKGTETPLGRMANKTLRELKKKAHASFDRLWQEGYMKRTKAYELLCGIMEKSPDEAHIGRFNEEECEKLIWFVTYHWGSPKVLKP